MYHHIKKLMYTVNVGSPDPRFGNMLLEQFGGANGELAAAMQYSIQGLNCDDPDRKDNEIDFIIFKLGKIIQSIAEKDKCANQCVNNIICERHLANSAKSIQKSECLLDVLVLMENGYWLRIKEKSEHICHNTPVV